MRCVHPVLFRGLAVATLGALTLPAHAGGVGVVAIAGGHADRVYGYTLNEDTEEYDQEKPESQFNTNLGTGLELVLGDKDDKVTGNFRIYFLSDSPQAPPKAGDAYVVRETSRAIGALDASLQFGFLGAPDEFQLAVVATMGSGFLTEDATEYIYGEAGLAATWMAARRVQVHASVVGGTRYRKRFYGTTTGYLGVRYMFD